MEGLWSLQHWVAADIHVAAHGLALSEDTSSCDLLY